MISQMDERPPYVMFEIRTVEDRDASIREGRYIAKGVNYVIVTAAGAKDTVERIADEWIADINRKAMSIPPRFNPQHAKHFANMYTAWKEGNELPEVGTPIKGWSVISPSEQENIISANIRTVEDLANISESGLERMGMGARNLKNKAIAWMASANDQGKVVSQLAALQQKVEEQDVLIQKLKQSNQSPVYDPTPSEKPLEVTVDTVEVPRTKRAYNRKPKPESQSEVA